MPKVTDILKLISGQISNENLTKAIGGDDINEAELSDEDFTDIETQIGGLMTFESAINNDSVVNKLISKVGKEVDSKVHKTLMSNMLHGIEKRMTDFGERIDVDLSNKNHHEQIETLFSNVGKLTNNTDNSANEKVIEDLNLQIITKQEEIDKINLSNENKFKNFKIDSLLNDTLSSYKLAEVYQDEFVKKSMLNGIKDQIKSTVTLKIGENDNLLLFEKDNPENKYFVNNKTPGITEFIDPLMQTYLQKSDPHKKVPTPDSLPDGPVLDNSTVVGQLKTAPKV